MSEFFNSTIVRETMKELEDMRDKLIESILELPYYGIQAQKEYLQLLRDFLEKQKVLLFRMSLSDDPEAVATKNEVLKTVNLLGWEEGEHIEFYFEKLEDLILAIEKSLGL